MQKLCRDSKGKFVNREVLIEGLKRPLRLIEAWRYAPVGTNPSFDIKYGDAHGLARHIRQFRNRYKIHECF